MKRYLFLISLLCVVSCDYNLDEDITELVSNKNKWLKSYGNKEYSFIYERHCFCKFGGQAIEIKVKNQKIISATKNGEAVDAGSFSTISQLFEMILEQYKNKDLNNLASIDIEYNSIAGYPEKIKIKSYNIDGDIFIKITDVVGM